MASRNDMALAVAIIGAGQMARQMIAVLVKLGRPITAIYSRSPERAQKLAQEFNLNSTIVYDSLLNLWEHDDAHYVYIASPNYTHARFALDAMYHGRDVIVETAMVLSVKELADIEHAIRSEKRIFMEANNVFFSPLIKKLARSMPDDTDGHMQIGRVGIIDVKSCRQNQDRQFFAGNTMTGGGAVAEVAAYPLAAAVALLGNDLKLLFSDVKFDDNARDLSGFAYFTNEANTRVCVKYSIEDSLPNVLYLGGNHGYIAIYEYHRTSIYRRVEQGKESQMIDIMPDIVAEYDLDPQKFNNFRDVALAVQILDFEKAVAAGYEHCYAEDLTNYTRSMTVVRLVAQILAEANNLHLEVKQSEVPQVTR